MIVLPVGTLNFNNLLPLIDPAVVVEPNVIALLLEVRVTVSAPSVTAPIYV